MTVYFLTPNAGSAGDTITHGDDDDMSLAMGRSIVDQVSGSHPLGTADAVILGQGTKLNYTFGHVIQPRRELEPRADITTGLPEQGIWIMLLIGFAGLCAAVFHRGRKDRLASPFGEDCPILDLSRVPSATSVERSSRET
jgi:hypothetical protein